MKKSAAAVLFHVASTDEKPWHDHCPDGTDSWCRYKKDRATGTNTFVHGKGLSLEVIKHAKPIFEDLQRDSLLTKCLHGKTQNQNESFNSTIWARIPKDVFVGGKTFTTGIMDSIFHFSDGNVATLDILEEIGLIHGYYTTIGCKNNNEERCNTSVRKSGEKYRSRRKYIRGAKISKSDKIKKKEGNVYSQMKTINILFVIVNIFFDRTILLTCYSYIEYLFHQSFDIQRVTRVANMSAIMNFIFRCQN